MYDLIHYVEREGKVPFLLNSNSFQTYVQLTWVLLLCRRRRSENFSLSALLLEEGELEVLLHQNLIQMPHKNKQVMHAKLQQLSRKLGTKRTKEEER